MKHFNKNLLFEILKHLPVSNYPNICLTCKYFNKCVNADELWKYKCEQECLDFYIFMGNNKQYYKCYKTFNQLTKLKSKLNYKYGLTEMMNITYFPQNIVFFNEIPKDFLI